MRLTALEGKTKSPSNLANITIIRISLWKKYRKIRKR